jgi:transposase
MKVASTVRRGAVRKGLHKSSTSLAAYSTQWSHGSVRQKLTYKAQRLGMEVVLQEEAHTSKTCPKCGHRRKSAPRGRVFRCTNKRCRFTWHRDGVGATNIWHKYRGELCAASALSE